MKPRLLISLALLALLVAQAAAATQPNIVCIVADDPGEARDLAALQPVRVAMLEAAWKELDAGMVAPLWGGPARNAR